MRTDVDLGGKKLAPATPPADKNFGAPVVKPDADLAVPVEKPKRKRVEGSGDGTP